jgi:hypothetical protein
MCDKIMAKTSRKDKESWARADKISAIGLIVGLLSVILSGGFMWLAYNANWISADAVKAANKANDLAKASRKADSIRSISDSIREMTNFQNQKKSLDLTKKSVESQLLDLEETRKQFEITHTPILQFDNLILNEFKVGKEVAIGFRINNLGGYPAKILADNSYMSVGTKFVPLSQTALDKKNSERKGNSITYIYNSLPASLSISSGANVSRQDSINFSTKKLFLYMHFDYTYENPINKKKRRFRSLAEFILPAKNYITYYSENFDIDNNN